MVVNDTFVDLGGVHEGERSEAINFSGETGGEVEDGVDGGIGKNINMGISGGKGKMGVDIVSGLRSV